MTTAVASIIMETIVTAMISTIIPMANSSSWLFGAMFLSLLLVFSVDFVVADDKPTRFVDKTVEESDVICELVDISVMLQSKKKSFYVYLIISFCLWLMLCKSSLK